MVATAVLALLAIGVIFWQRQQLPEPGSAAYEQTTRAFYHGLAALEVGLLDDARQQFTSATLLVPREPASWANLGLTQMRLGELDAAAEPIQRALSLAPDNSDLVLLAARLRSLVGGVPGGDHELLRPRLLQRPRELDGEGVVAAAVLADVRGAALQGVV